MEALVCKAHATSYCLDDDGDYSFFFVVAPAAGDSLVLLVSSSISSTAHATVRFWVAAVVIGLVSQWPRHATAMCLRQL